MAFNMQTLGSDDMRPGYFMHLRKPISIRDETVYRESGLELRMLDHFVIIIDIDQTLLYDPDALANTICLVGISHGEPKEHADVEHRQTLSTGRSEEICRLFQ